MTQISRGVFGLLLVSVLSMETGCARKYWVAPSISGKVIDADSGAALSGVQVRRTTRDDRTPTLVGTTAADGSYSIEGKQRIEFVLVPLGDPIRAGEYLFRLDGYKEKRLDFGLFAGDVVGQDCPSRPGDVRLERE